MKKYQNRSEAGQLLSEFLKSYAGKKDTLVLALPRGGVPVAYEIAQKLHLPLDIFLVRKLGVPGHEELAMGAMASNGEVIFNQKIIKDLSISKMQIDKVIEEEAHELKRRELLYRGSKPFPTLSKKTIILVDDGMATGATMRAAVAALRKLDPSQIIIAVPVAAKKTVSEFSTLADQLICPLIPNQFNAVGLWYEEFDQTSDAEVCQFLS